jgi:hypothetical protein
MNLDAPAYMLHMSPVLLRRTKASLIMVLALVVGAGCSRQDGCAAACST